MSVAPTRDTRVCDDVCGVDVNANALTLILFPLFPPLPRPLSGDGAVRDRKGWGVLCRPVREGDTPLPRLLRYEQLRFPHQRLQGENPLHELCPTYTPMPA